MVIEYRLKALVSKDREALAVVEINLTDLQFSRQPILSRPSCDSRLILPLRDLFVHLYLFHVPH